MIVSYPCKVLSCRLVGSQPRMPLTMRWCVTFGSWEEWISFSHFVFLAIWRYGLPTFVTFGLWAVRLLGSENVDSRLWAYIKYRWPKAVSSTLPEIIAHGEPLKMHVPVDSGQSHTLGPKVTQAVCKGRSCWPCIVGEWGVCIVGSYVLWAVKCCGLSTMTGRERWKLWTKAVNSSGFRIDRLCGLCPVICCHVWEVWIHCLTQSEAVNTGHYRHCEV